MFVNKCRRLFAITSFRVYMSKLTGAQPQNLQKESYEFFLLTLKTKRTHVSYNTRTFFLSFNVDVRLRTNLRIVSKTVHMFMFFKFKLYFMCKDTYVPHTFLFRMFITYLMYTLVTIIKVKMVAEKNAFKECFNCFNCSFKYY